MSEGQAVQGIFLRMDGPSVARIFQAVRAAGHQPTAEGVAAWALEAAERQSRPNLGGAVRTAAAFLRDNPEALRAGLAMLRGR